LGDVITRSRLDQELERRRGQVAGAAQVGADEEGPTAAIRPSSTRTSPKKTSPICGSIERA
jgi:hypothetical protein